MPDFPESPRARPVKPWKDDPFESVPAYDADAPNPAATALTVPTTPEPDPPLTDEIAALTDKIRAFARELLTASPARSKQLSLDIQRHRLAKKLLIEIDSNVEDPDTYKELSMLNRMIAGEEDLDDPESDEVKAEAAEKYLLEQNIGPDRARRLIRTIEALNAAAEVEDGPVPEAPDQRRRGSKAH